MVAAATISGGKDDTEAEGVSRVGDEMAGVGGYGDGADSEIGSNAIENDDVDVDAVCVGR